MSDRMVMLTAAETCSVTKAVIRKG